MYIKSFKQLKVWERAMQLAEEIYSLTQSFPKNELFGLVSQMRRSAVSIPSNISEGRGRSTRKDFVKFLFVAYGSLCELETQIILTRKIYKSIDCDKAYALITETGKMLTVMINKLQPQSRN